MDVKAKLLEEKKYKEVLRKIREDFEERIRRKENIQLIGMWIEIDGELSVEKKF